MNLLEGISAKARAVALVIVLGGCKGIKRLETRI